MDSLRFRLWLFLFATFYRDLCALCHHLSLNFSGAMNYGRSYHKQFPLLLWPNKNNTYNNSAHKSRWSYVLSSQFCLMCSKNTYQMCHTSLSTYVLIPKSFITEELLSTSATRKRVLHWSNRIHCLKKIVFKAVWDISQNE